MNGPDEREDPFPGPVRVTDVLDLHGFFPEQIHGVLDEFVRNARDLDLSILKIIHGKGKSRLKFEVVRYLETCPEVLRFYDASPESGGWGSTVVELLPPADRI
jgi:DNA-nicking Smr family endonuclease